MLKRWRHNWQKKRLKDPSFQFLFEVPPDEDVVCFDCETTGLNPKKDSLISLSAVKIRGQSVLTSQALNLTFSQAQPISEASIKVHMIRNQDALTGLPPQQAMQQFLQFIGSRPLVGYYLEFDVAMVNQVIRPWLGIQLPNPQIEVSELYYDLKFSQQSHAIPQPAIDLSFQTILDDLQIPNFGQHDAFNDALMTALVYLKLTQLKRKP